MYYKKNYYQEEDPIFLTLFLKTPIKLSKTTLILEGLIQT